MGSNELNSQGDFNAKIAEAVDDLFSAVRQIEIDPATNEVREVEGSSFNKSKDSSALELEEKGKSKPAPAAKLESQELLSKLDQSLMTLDWEVSRSNAGNMRDLLDKAVREYDLGPLVGEGGVISLMHKVLIAMSEGPENVPTSGPLALKSSLTSLKAAIVEGQPYSAETEKLLVQAQNALLSVIPGQGTPSAALQATPSSAPRVEAVSAAPPLPQQFRVILENHVARIDQLLNKRLVPVQNFFGKTASLAKLYVVVQSVNDQLAEQIEQLKAALDGRYDNVMPVADPVGISIKLGNDCQMLMQYHLQVLNHCARRIAPIEKLFADLDGQQKLHAIHFEIRSGLMAQLHYLASALDGDFGPLPPLPKFAVAAARPASGTSTPQQAGMASAAPSSSCPWPTLLVARRRGEHIAFIPEQVCFEGKGGFGAGNVAHQHSLKLKNLKPWPWSSLKSKMRGGLAEKSNKELTSLEFPVLDIPVVASGLDGENIIVLFQASKGGVVLVDTPLEDLEITEHFEWKASATSDGDIIIGNISSDFGDSIPVVDVNRL